MTKLPYNVHNAALLQGAGRRIAIALTVFFATVAAMAVTFYLLLDHRPWGAVVLLFPFIGVKLAGAWMRRRPPRGLVVFHFDRGCRRMALEENGAVVEFAAHEVQNVSVEGGVVHFEVRGQRLQFPFVVTPGSFRTSLHLCLHAPKGAACHLRWHEQRLLVCAHSAWRGYVEPSGLF